MEGRSLTAPAFYRPLNVLGLYNFGTYAKAGGTFVPDDTLGGAVYFNPGPITSTMPGGGLGFWGQGSFSGMNQLAAGSLLDGATVPPYSTTTTSSAEFAVGHNHTESGNSFAAAGGLLSVLTQATGTDGWAIDDWQNATVTVEFEIDAVVPSDYSWTQIDIRFQSTYFGFTLIGDSDQATLTLLDGTGVPTSSTGFFGAGGIGGDVETFTVPAAAQFNVAYNSYMLTQFAGSGMEPIQASVEQQFIDWHVSFTLH